MNDLITTNAQVTNFTEVSPLVFRFTLVPNGVGTVSVDIPAGSAINTIGVGNRAASLSRIFDNVSPTVVINQAAGQGDPTEDLPVRFAVTFSKPVTGFNAGNVTDDTPRPALRPSRLLAVGPVTSSKSPV